MNQTLKRPIDIVCSLLAIIFLSPIWLAIIFWIWLDSGRPIFFLQQRIGKNGRLFWMYKFRSMVVSAESMDQGLFSYEGDKRITLPGRYIRAASLDELPQLINILKGEMSIVGPRPPVVYELGNYADFNDRLKNRFIVKPGLTGLAQISGRNILSWDQKIEYDLKYIERFKRFGVWEDLRIIFLTLGIVVSMQNTIELRPDGDDKSP